MEEKKKFGFPLWAKSLLAFAFSVSIVSTVAVIFSSNAMVDITRSRYIEEATHAADTLALYLNIDDVQFVQSTVDEQYKRIPEEQKVSNEEWDSSEWLAYLAKYSNVPSLSEYQRLLAQLEAFHAKIEARYTYIAYADYENERFIYLVDDSPMEERCLPGSFDFFTESDKTIREHLKEGFYPEITNTEEYGYLVSTGRPIFGENKEEPVAFAMVELSMDEITAKERANTANLAVLLGILAVGSTLAGFILVMLWIIRPMRKLTHVANEYTNDKGGDFDKFSKVVIHTRDEIEDLSNAMKKMEGDLNKYIDDLFSAEKKANEMKKIADIDAMTGVANKRAYFERENELNVLIQEGKAEFALTMIDLNGLKEINDNLGHEKGDDVINGLAELIKKHYHSSSIYRVGGDEFVVLQEGEAVKNALSLEERFAKALEATKDGDLPISAALGTAIFDPEIDNNVEDTFKRADAKMYERKREMKSDSK